MPEQPMTADVARIAIHNKTERPRIVWAPEPIPEDYTLLPGEYLEIVAANFPTKPWFELVEWKDSTQVYIAGVGADALLHNDITVLQAGRRLSPGHQRDKGLAAGLKY